MNFKRKSFSNEQLISIYKSLIFPRMIEEKMLILLRQGKISKWFSGIGQEAIAVGTTLALHDDEYIMPMHRNLGVFTCRKMPLDKLFMQWQGKENGYSKGRERSFHFGSNEHHICGMISHLGPQLSIANGVALAHKLNHDDHVALAFTGDGATSEGEFHEAMNVAAVWGLPVIFIIENNGYGLSTPNNEQFICKQLADKGIGYGIKAITIDGNNILEVLTEIKNAREYCIQEQKPIIIECMTFRMRGHEEASGVKYVPVELFEIWGKKDPILNYEQFLLKEKILTERDIEEIKIEFKKEIDKSVEAGFEAKDVEPNTQNELQDVFAPFQSKTSNVESKASSKTEMKFIHAIANAIDLAMQKHTKLILMGQDIAEYGGAFKVTDGMWAKYGKERVRNTPLCESGILGAALGLSIKGYKSMVEMQFADFVTVGFNQIINNLAKIHYRWGQNADVVVRMPTGAGVGAGPFHSQSNEAWFTHTPGLKVVYPSTPEDAKGLLLSAFEDPNPVLFFEHKALYRSVTSQVNNEYYTIEIGKANKVLSGTDISVITYGAGVHWMLEYANQNPTISIHLLDLRTLSPLDYPAIEEAVKETGKVMILHEDTLIGGIGGEISAWISEHCFQYLDAPIVRCASLDTPVPFDISLEKNFLAKSRIATSIEQLLNY
ncbi:MAG TPA: dehydrogenase E1 component subunit alpha/beta [Chitinophagaceae bacterium]|nr:dehydrogenase E1 component subunit alpha/beta [Chitinophagaceae bacterium]